MPSTQLLICLWMLCSPLPPFLILILPHWPRYTPRACSTRRLHPEIRARPSSRMMTDHAVTLVKDSMLEFNVMFHGPKGSTCVYVDGLRIVYSKWIAYISWDDWWIWIEHPVIEHREHHIPLLHCLSSRTASHPRALCFEALIYPRPHQFNIWI